ncbi:MAG: Ig-like domain-containing protein [Terriglobales bacterium]
MSQLDLSSFRPKLVWAVISFLFLGLLIAGCSGGGSSTVTPTSISLSPTTVSLKYGDVAAVSAQVLDNNGNVMTNQKFTWSSSNSSVASVTATGGTCGDPLNSTATTCVCGGTWSTDLINCTGPTQPGQATITVTSGSLSATLPALVHAPVARVAVSPNNVDCLSAKGTQQLTATAYDAQGTDITNTVAIDASSFNWSSSDATVVSVDTKGLATAVNPGRARLYASIAGTSSAPANFTTCPVVSVTLAAGTGTTFSIAQAATQQLTPTVTDSNGNTITITSGRLLYSSSYGQALSVDSTGLATGLNPGNSTIVASCSPPFCNNGLYPVFSNVVTGTTQGTTATGTNSKTTQVLVASLSDTKLVPIDITTSTAGTALTLPYQPNSLVYSRASGVAYLGSSTALMAYTYSTNTVGAIALVPGVILTLSNDGGRIVIYDDTAKTVTVYNLTSGTVVDKYSTPSATPGTVHASVAPDDQTAYIVVGNQLYVSSSTASLRTISLNAAANDVAFLLQGPFAYLAGGQTVAITARTTCDNSERDVVATTTPDRIVASGDGTKVYAVAGSVMDTVTATTNGAGCPPTLSDSLSSVDLGLGTIAPTQMFSNPTGTKVYMVSSAGQLIVFNSSTNSGSVISLNGSAKATTAGLTMDGANLWVGGGADKNVHRIDTSSNSDAQQISVGISADLVAVKNQ